MILDVNDFTLALYFFQYSKTLARLGIVYLSPEAEHDEFVTLRDTILSPFVEHNPPPIEIFGNETIMFYWVVSHS